MKMNYIYKMTIVGLTSLLFVGCTKDWLDVNKNPNAATEVSSEYLFGYATTSWSGNRTGGDCWTPIAFMNQTVSTGGANGWGSMDEYDISPYSLGNTWKLYYATGGANFKQAIQLAEKAKRTNVVAQCKIAFASMFFECTMIYGDVPFSQAWSDINDPVFDKQKDILDGLLSLLDEAIKQVDLSNPDAIKSEDLYYQGDMNKWIAFANSMKLKIAMVMVDKDPSKSSLIANLINQSLIDELDENVKFPFFDESDHKNPMNRIIDKYNNGVNDWFFANTSILEDMMLPIDDPRIPIFYKPGEKSGGVFIGLDTSIDAPDKGKKNALLSEDSFLKGDANDLILSSQQINMYIAEAYLRGLGVGVDKNKADKYFKKGLKQALSYYGVEETDIKSFLAKPELDLKTVSDPLTVLRKQQYVDLAGRPLEAWIQQRRSGKEGHEIPNLKAPPLATGFPKGKIARRWIYSPDELSGNSNAPKDIPNMWDNMWFDE